MKPQIIELLGISGSGKGTQAELLEEKLDLDYIGSGELLRARAKKADFTGKKIRRVLMGGFVPTSVIFKLWMDEWEKLKNRSKFRGFVVDGSPRKLLEAQLIDQTLQWYDWGKYLRVILIDVSRGEAFKRLARRKICKTCGRVVHWSNGFKEADSCGECGGKLVLREDDTPEGIKGRFADFKKYTTPVIKYYEKSDRLMKVNGEQSIEDVHKDIMKALS